MAHTIYENFILENKLADMLTTKIDLNSYMTINTSLTQEPGMKLKVLTYDATSGVEKLAMGQGNSKDIEVSFTETEYEVETFQGRFVYYDEEEMTDPMVVDTGLAKIAADMVNKFTELAIAEYDKATLVQEGTAWDFDIVVDAIAKMNLEAEDGLFLLISPADKAAFRKALKEDLSYSEGFVRTGYIGSVAGVPVVVTKAVEAGTAYLATKDAVTVFIKKNTEIEQDRDADKRKNFVWGRKVAVVALTDANKVVKITVGA
ncbi:MAG: hypothetical protein IKU15_00595 [Clostridia bacterium]|nr:hypothetical protein [Clostridia bacterium]MBR4889799.1 hypothetical protein [Clostridia bacterium]